MHGELARKVIFLLGDWTKLAQEDAISVSQSNLASRVGKEDTNEAVELSECYGRPLIMKQ